jgi:hypothetical protein
MTLNGVTIGDRHRFFQAALLCSAFLFSLFLAGRSSPAMASPITGVTVSPATAGIHSWEAVYLRATVQGTGDFDHRVNWSLSPTNAGNLSPTGLFISDPGFSGAATIKATSVENPKFSGTANITVSSGAGVVHVDHNNAGIEDGSALHPYRTIQGAVAHATNGATIKVAQGTYTENVALPMFGVLLLGGFKGGSAADYDANLPGDFVTRSTDHATLVTTIQSPALTAPVVAMLDNWDPPNALTYAVDGFTLTGGSNGMSVSGGWQIAFFISQNLITDNGVEVADASTAGGGIHIMNVNPVILNNQVSNNKIGWGGGIYLDLASNSSFLVQGNLIENNRAGSDRAGGAWLTGPQGLFTWNVVRGNHAATLLNYGYGGGVLVNAGQAELNRNVYTNNQTPSLGGGLHVEEAANVVIYHELIYKNATEDSGASGVSVAGAGTHLEAHHCTITDNNGGDTDGNGLSVREGTAQVSNSIIWGNSGSQLYVAPAGSLTMTYSDSQAYPGTGNISVDPLFASPGTDDYHLKSKKGRWNPATSQWVRDAVHSPGIDAGNPVSPYDQEPIPNAFRANMGVYGNTPQASKSQREPMFGGVLELLLLGG